MASGPPGSAPAYPPDPRKVQQGGYAPPAGGPPGYPPPAGGPPGYPPQQQPYPPQQPTGYPLHPGYTQHQQHLGYPPVQPGPPGPGGQPTQAVREGYTNRPPVIYYPPAQDVRREGDVYQVRNSEERQQEEAEEQRNPFAPSFMDKKIRHNFVAKVFAIVGLQFLFTTAFIATCFFVKDIRRFFIRNRSPVMIVAMILYMVFACSIMCCQNLRRKFPWNYLLLAGLTFAVSFLGAVITATFSFKPVLIAFGSTALVLLIITIVSVFRLVDITKCSGIISVLVIIFLVFVLGMTLVSFFVSPQVVRVMDLVMAGLATVLVSLFLMFDIQTIMGGRRIEISPEEYILAATQIYIDTFTLFILTLCLGGALAGDN